MQEHGLDKCLNEKLLVVGAGGIGCELIKNLVCSGFNHIDLIDLDTIDVSNLNRQFLFHKSHVGRSKAEVAKESALKFNPCAAVNHFHNSIQSAQFDVDFFSQYALVLNALDNRAARSHVNRMCLASNVPLVESGSAGYLGQVTVIKRGVTECYECNPKPTQRTYAGCTIRNTPSEPVHCVVWAKHLFNQLFGETDPDEEVSPDMEDPELKDEKEAENGISSCHMSTEINGQKNEENGSVESVTVTRVSTRKWAEENKYDPTILFGKLFNEDIFYLLSMDALWKNRPKPTPLSWKTVPEHMPSTSSDAQSAPDHIKGQEMWSPARCRDIFQSSVLSLKQRHAELPEGHVLTWDKDDDVCMDFVAASANLRAFIFGIPLTSRFDLKSIAGNIIPAIATSNAIVAGLMVIEAIKCIQGRLDECATVYLNRKPNYRNRLLVSCVLEKPNPSCHVCSPKPEVVVKLDITTFTLKDLEGKVLKEELNMIAPDVESAGNILISSEEGETTGLHEKVLSDFNLRNKSRLSCDDFQQQYSLTLIIVHSTEVDKDKGFEIMSDSGSLKAVAESAEDDQFDQMGGQNPIVGKKRSLSQVAGDTEDETEKVKIQRTN